MLVVVVLVAVAVPLLPDYAPLRQNLTLRLLPPGSSWSHVLGTDELGRDILSRLSMAMRTSLEIVVAALLLNIVVGVLLGMLAGLLGGVVESVIMGLADLQLSMPLVILVVTVVSIVGSTATSLAVVIGFSYWVGYGRVSRVIALSLREREFVLSATTEGAGTLWILRKHVLPQILPQIWIIGSFDLGALIILEASLSYLGLGIQPPLASLGGMIFDGQQYLAQDSWLCIIPGIMIFFVVGGVQLLSSHFTSEGVQGRTLTLQTGV
jgi:peptide/nickel transport system permease protein